MPTSRLPHEAALTPFEREGGENPYSVQHDLQDTMHNLVGIIRKAEEVEQALVTIEDLKARVATLSVEGHRQYNPGWHLSLDLRNMLLVSECVARAALDRKESRGGHTRDDYPLTDPELGEDQRAVQAERRRHRRRGVPPGSARHARRPQGAVRGEPLMGYDLKMRVWRGDDNGGDLVDYTVPVEEGEVVLDAIHRLQATQAGDLAVRWNCKAGKCGSCSAEINGRPRLLCMTRLSIFEPTETITVTPMRTFPVMRDLVTDVSFNYEKAKQVPAFTPPAEPQPGDYRMQQVDVERSQEFRKCIECFLCQNTCHVVRDHEENKPAFAGPRFFIRYAELDMHPLDTVDRKQMLQDEQGLGHVQHHQVLHRGLP